MDERRWEVENGDDHRAGTVAVAISGERAADWNVDFRTLNDGPLTTVPACYLITAPYACDPQSVTGDRSSDLAGAVPSAAKLIRTGKRGRQGSLEKRYLLTVPGRHPVVEAISFKSSSPSRGQGIAIKKMPVRLNQNCAAAPMTN